jgi:hypothetical protein
VGYSHNNKEDRDMSETERNKGKLIPVDHSGTVEEKCKAVIDEMGLEMKSYYDSYKEMLDDEGYRAFYITETEVYKVESEALDTDMEIFDATLNDDGTINFHTMYYNGGCSFNEALDVSIKRAKSDI